MTNGQSEDAAVAWLFRVKDEAFPINEMRFVSAFPQTEEAKLALITVKSDILFDDQRPLNQADLDALRKATGNEDEAVFEVNVVQWQNSGVRIDT